MNVEITEYEREFLERLCTRAEVFANIANLRTPEGFSSDMGAIKTLKNKFRELDSKLMEKAMKNDNI